MAHSIYKQEAIINTMSLSVKTYLKARKFETFRKFDEFKGEVEKQLGYC